MSEFPPQDQPKQGLPPVTPPSGRFIARFLVPGLIVLLAVLMLMMFHNLFGGGQTGEQYLRQLDSDNTDIRWRAASDLAKTLERPESIALRIDPDFAFELAERLRRAIEERDQHPGIPTEKPANDLVYILQSNPNREYISFLTQAVARLQTPLAIPVLCNMAKRPEESDRVTAVLLRRQALLALAITGDNLKTFATLLPEQQAGIINRLHEWTNDANPRKAISATTALYYLDKKSIGSKDVVLLDRVLAQCADYDDPFCREMVALCLRFWDGDEVPATLRKLAKDDGHGRLLQFK